MEWGRALPAMSRVHTSAALEETANGLGTPRANRAMERSRARLVNVLDLRASVEEQLDHGHLRGGVPRLTALWPRVARIMQSDCAPPILGVRGSSRFYQRRDGVRPECRRRKVEGRISDVQLVRDFRHETLIGHARLRDRGRRSYKPDRVSFVGDDSREELAQDRR